MHYVLEVQLEVQLQVQVEVQLEVQALEVHRSLEVQASELHCAKVSSQPSWACTLQDQALIPAFFLTCSMRANHPRCMLQAQLRTVRSS
mmetsp:Transcript_107604/g.208409  ORF Transcript_107604/g.208409 Transcript_107604/m.208409 type:complete len:89 (+) Transcript_107604:632-898(+)